MKDPFKDPFTTPTYPLYDAASDLLGSRWYGWKVVKWPGDRALPREGDFGYGGRKAVYVDRVTGDLLGTSPQPAIGAETLHSFECRDAGPWPAEPVDCPACRA